MLQWLHNNGEWLIMLALLSAASFVVMLVAVPVVVLRLPQDYFCHQRREPLYRDSAHPAAGVVLALLKNAVGALLVVAGAIMLFTPGQGLLSILLGAVLMNFPGKYRVERWLARQSGILPAMNWLRGKFGKPPLDPPVDRND